MANRQLKLESGMNYFTVEDYLITYDKIIATNQEFFNNEEFIVENGKIYLIIHY